MPWLLALALVAGLTAVQAQEAEAPSAEAAQGTVAGSGQSDEEYIEDILAGDSSMTAGGYVYDEAGRRDPFVNPLGRGEEGEGNERPRPPGFAGMLINEVRLWGITVFEEAPIAIFRGTDGLGYFVQEGDELWDGKIVAVDFDTREVVFQQRVEDPTSPVRFREVVSRLVD